MRRTFLTTLLAGALLTGLAGAVPVKLGTLPLSLEPNAKLLTLNQAGIAQAYPSAAGRPDAVFLTEDRKVTMSFEWRQGKLSGADVTKLVSQFPSVIRSQVPNLKSLKSGTLESGGSTWAQFVFTTPGKTDDLRREMLVTSLQGRMFVITVAGTVKDYSRNEAVVQSLLRSIKLD
ncbi:MULTISPECIES: hypothetical protein [Deinococcus]|jgi:hypothetical protein|uniref:DUF1795 domain-containing protein n=2 Tax=Deinococcus TaxID=1298 RepID=A0A221SW05_9DEIO|nr:MULTISPECIES: hypothetical protein [Deinococcus]ASN80827.1 hypothetical protein DFI_07250 [Deinococcus ficus]MDP9762817.1 hypothetical protein [Deinococcus enclensis]GHF78293.1 hypothetical protein GCM10017782_15370 [Deinococcus ficus]